MFLINQTTTNVGIMDGRYLVPVGESIELSEGDEKQPQVLEAIRRGWVKLSNTQDGAVPGPAKIEMGSPAVHGSKTIPKKEKKATV